MGAMSTLWEVRVVYAFDSLGYAKRLRDRGIPQGHAEAARDFIMAELFTKADALLLRQDIDARFAALDSKFTAKFEEMSLRLTVRLGAMLAAAVALLAAIQKLS